MPPQRAACSMIDAPTCTVGPSRPMEAPQNRPTTVSRILPAASRSESRRLRSASSRRCRAAIACGMPLPCAPGNSTRDAHAQATKPAGVTTSGSQAFQPSPAVMSLNRCCAASASLANSTLMRPMAIAPAQNTSRGCQTRLDASIARERRSIGIRFELRAMVCPLAATLPLEGKNRTRPAPVNLCR